MSSVAKKMKILKTVVFCDLIIGMFLLNACNVTQVGEPTLSPDYIEMPYEELVAGEGTAVPLPTTNVEIPTLRPTQTPTVTPSPATRTPTPFPEMTGERGSDPEYWFMWSTPLGWIELTDQWPLPSEKTVLWRVWADQADAATLLADKTAPFPDGLMAFTLQVETGAKPLGTEVTTVYRQTRWVDEQQGAEAAPFDLRLEAVAWREPYLYTFALNCLSPTGANNNAQEAFNAYCRYVWDFYDNSFSLCAPPNPPSTGPIVWQTVASSYDQYSFEVPADWYDDSGPTPDRVTYFSHPVHLQPPNGCPIPEGTMKVEFFVEGHPSGQSLARYTAVSPIDGYSAWMTSFGDAEDETSPIHAKGLIVQGPVHWYMLSLYCWPQWTGDSEQIFTHMVESFEITR
jgi:hypothetical protein